MANGQNRDSILERLDSAMASLIVITFVIYGVAAYIHSVGLLEGWFPQLLAAITLGLFTSATAEMILDSLGLRRFLEGIRYTRKIMGIRVSISLWVVAILLLEMYIFR